MWGSPVNEEEGTEDLSKQRRCVISPESFQGHSKECCSQLLFFHSPPLAADEVELELGPLSSTDLQVDERQVEAHLQGHLWVEEGRRHLRDSVMRGVLGQAEP